MVFFIHNFTLNNIVRVFQVIFGKSFAKNWSLLTLSKLFCQAIGMLATVRVARLLSPEGYGYFNLMQSTASLGVVLAGLGIRQVIIRKSARYPEQCQSILSSSIILLAISGFIVGICIVTYCSILTHTVSFTLSGISFGLVLGLLLWDLVESIAFGNERMESSAYINIIGSLIWTLLVWVAPLNFFSINNLCFTFVFLQCTKSLIYYYFLKKADFFRKTQVKTSLLKLVYESLPFYWLAVLSIATIQLPLIILAKRSNILEVGFYSAAEKVISPFQMIMYAGVLALYPSLSKIAFKNNKLYMTKVKHFIVLSVFFNSIIGMSISIFRGEITPFLFGIQYTQTADTLFILAWYPSLMNTFALISCILSSLNKQFLLAKLATLYAIISLPLIWYGAKFGSYGLATSLLLSSLINMTYHWIIMERKLPQYFDISYKFGIILIIFISVILSYAIPTTMPIIFKVFVLVFFVMILSISLIIKNVEMIKYHFNNDSIITKQS